MLWLDWLIVVAYLVYVIWDGVRLNKKSNDVEGFFLAGRSMPWWAVGLSVMATQASAITLVGTTGQGYDDGLRFVQFYYALPIAMVILSVTVVPFFHKAKVYTAYEYLEQRFDAKTRSLTSFFFLVSRALGVGVVISAPAVVLSVILGWNLILTVFAIGLATTFYTMFGGIRAVTWTDVKQMILIFVALGIALYMIVSAFPEEFSFVDGLYLAGASGKLTTVETSFDLTEKYTIWSGLFAALFLFLSYFGCDQSQVQRYLTAKSVDDGRTSLLMSAVLKIPMQFMILLIGVLIFVFYQFQTPPMIFDPNASELAKEKAPAKYQKLENEYKTLHAERLKAAGYMNQIRNDRIDLDYASAKKEYLEKNSALLEKRKEAKSLVKEVKEDSSFNDVNYIFPTFILGYLPMGLVGLLIAAIFAAAMSSISSELNALATASTLDFYRRHFKPDGKDEDYVFFGRIATLVWGLFACVVAIYATNLGSLIEVVNKFGSYFYGSLLGVFILAMMIPRARARGAFFGLLIGMATVGIWSQYTDVAFLWFNVVGTSVTVATGYLISLTVSEES